MADIPNRTVECLAEVVLKHSDADITGDCTLGGSLQLAEAGPLKVSWAPFEHVRTGARVVLVGITPGRSQATEALRVFRRALGDGSPLPAALEMAKDAASFAGSMRRNLAAMLDHVGMNEVLAVPTCATLFGTDRDLVHYTSALRYPVFLNDANYSGNPSFVRVPLLCRMVDEILAREAAELQTAIWIPIGPGPALALERLVRAGHLDARRILAGIPHASGANAERIAYFLGRKKADQLSSKTNAMALDDRRRTLIMKVSALRAG